MWWLGWTFTALGQGIPALAAPVLALVVTWQVLDLVGMTGWLWLGLWAAWLVVAHVQSPMATAARIPILAAIVGTLPHVVFVFDFNRSAPGETGEDFLPTVRHYEYGVLWLEDTLGPWLAPSLIMSAVLTVTLFRLSSGQIGLRLLETWRATRSAAGFLALVLSAATTFTLFSNVPVKAWRPDVTYRLRAQLTVEAQRRTELAVYEALTEEARKAPGAVAELFEHSGRVFDELRRQHVDVPRREVLRVAAEGLAGDGLVAASLIDPEPRRQAQRSLLPALRRSMDAVPVLDRHVGAAHDELLKLLSTAAGKTIDPVVGEVIGSMVEEYAGLLARRLLAAQPSTAAAMDRVAAWLASGAGSQELRRLARAWARERASMQGSRVTQSMRAAIHRAEPRLAAARARAARPFSIPGPKLPSPRR